MGTNTTNFSFYKPSGSDSGDDNTWGDAATNSLNKNLDDLDGYLGNTAFGGLLPGPVAEQEYRLFIKIPFPGTITETTTKSSSGTCTATFDINGTDLGGTANSVSSSQSSQAHASDNTFVAGDYIAMTITSNSSCKDLSLSIAVTRTG